MRISDWSSDVCSSDLRSLHGLVRALVSNMVQGVTTEFTKELEIIGVGYRVLNSGTDSLELALGYSHTINYKAPAGVTFEVPGPTQRVVRGIDTQPAGQVAVEVSAFGNPER